MLIFHLIGWEWREFLVILHLIDWEWRTFLLILHLIGWQWHEFLYFSQNKAKQSRITLDSVLKITLIVLYANLHLTETEDHSCEAIKVIELVTWAAKFFAFCFFFLVFSTHRGDQRVATLSTAFRCSNYCLATSRPLNLKVTRFYFLFTIYPLNQMFKSRE